MKKKIFLTGLCAMIALSALAACGEKTADAHKFTLHEAVAADCDSEGNHAYYTCTHCDKIFDAEKQEIAQIPTIPAVGHAYKYHAEVAGTCASKGTIAHYTCEDCDKLFDGAKKEISSVEGSISSNNHLSTPAFTLTAQPTKVEYSVGDVFDPTGMVIVYKCNDCDGKTIDNQLLTVEYQTAGATAFAAGDTKVTVKYQDFSQEIPVTLSQKQAQILGVAESYTTTCGQAPEIEATTDVSDGQIVVSYYDGEVAIEPSALTAGKTYTAKLTIADTEEYLGAEKAVTIVVNHAHSWRTDGENWQKLVYGCDCGELEDFYALDYQTPYVEEGNLAIDLSKFIVGAEEYSITSIQQIVRMIDGNYALDASKGQLVDIAYTNTDWTYTFALDKYEKPTNEYKPYILTLLVTYEVEGVECPVHIEAKCVDKVIMDAEDLKLLAYMGDPNDQGGEAKNAYYVLGQDIDASGVEITESQPCFKDASGFIGVFDGNGYTISNLKITGGQGLFGALGKGAKVQNVAFENVYVASDLYALAYCARSTAFTNVTIEFDTATAAHLVAYSANDCSFENVTILMSEGVGNPFLINENTEKPLPEGIAVNYYVCYTVTFNTDGAGDMAPVSVVAGKTLAIPQTPVKPSDDFDYLFLGWYNGETEWDFDTPITEDIELTAKWEQTEKSNVLLNAKTQTLTKWDYGHEITVTNGTDETYGDIWIFTADAIKEQGIQHPTIDTTGYEKVSFHVYNPCTYAVRFSIHGAVTWGAASIMLPANAWTRIEVNMSLFKENNLGQIHFVLQDPDAVSVAGEWKITSFYGVVEEEKPANLLLDSKTQTLTKWDYGHEITVTNGTDETYGDIWVFTVDAIVEQGIQHPAIDTADYQKVYFYVYNPCAYEIRLNIHGTSTWGAASIMLSANGWTRVEVNMSLFKENDMGQIRFIIQDPDAASVAGEWKITSFYGVEE